MRGIGSPRSPRIEPRARETHRSEHGRTFEDHRGERFPRPNILTPEAQGIILGSLAAGNFYTVACASAGIHYESFRRWRERCEAGDPIAVRQFEEFFAAVGKVLAVAEMAAVAEVRSGTPNWRASAWFLERRFPKRWGRKYRVS